MIKCERIVIAPFDMKYLQDYCSGFNTEITRYQWPDPFETLDDARDVLQGFLDEMEKGETLFFSVLMVSNLRFFSFKMKSAKWKSNEVRWVFLIVAVVSFAIFRMVALPFVMMFYVLLSIFFGGRME